MGTPVPAPFTDEGQIWCAITDPRSTFTCEISSGSVYSVVLWRRKKKQFLPFFAVFWPSAFSDVAIWHQFQKVEHGCTTTNFPLSMASKSFLYSNAFMAKSGAQTLTFKSVTDIQTKTQRFWLPRLRVKSEPHQTWHRDRGTQARSFTSKTFGGLTHSFAARGR